MRIGLPFWSTLLAGCAATTLATPPAQAPETQDAGAFGRMALVPETEPATEQAPGSLERSAQLTIRFVQRPTSRTAQSLPLAVRQSGSIKVFVTVGNQTFEANYGTYRQFGVDYPLSSINLYSDTSSPANASFKDLPTGFAKVTAKAYDDRDGMGNLKAEATANINLVPGAGNKVRLAFIRSGEPRLLGVYEQVGSDATASVDAGPTGFFVTLHVEDILEPNAPDAFKILVGNVVAKNVMNGLTDAGRGTLQFQVQSDMTKGKIQLVNAGATASLQPDFKRISRFSISPTSADVNAGGSQTFVGKCFDTDNAEFVPQNPKITYKVNASPQAEPEFFSTNPENRRKLGIINQQGVYTAPAQPPESGLLDMVYFGITDLNQATASAFIN
ncbi:MAG: hypothetical protein VKO64_12030 [Candidatus Sericytochromatia bacterium]|nr:hypothetical protein [Candidatus Sericytochromatia bacterium]